MEKFTVWSAIYSNARRIGLPVGGNRKYGSQTLNKQTFRSNILCLYNRKFMWCVRVHFSVYSYSLNDLRRKGLNKYRVVQYVFDFFTFFSKKKSR